MRLQPDLPDRDDPTTRQAQRAAAQPNSEPDVAPVAGPSRPATPVMKVSVDGEMADSGRISVLDHGLLYGDGVFEGMRVYSQRLFSLERHLARLEVGARALGLALPGGTSAIAETTLSTARAFIEATGVQDAYVRLIVSRGQGALGVDPVSCPVPTLVCIVSEVRLFPAETLRRGLSMITSSRRAPAPDVRDPRVKSLNYLNNVLAKQEASRRGADDALLLNAQGMITEASVANVFVVRSGRLLTPPVTDGCLEGITRASVMQLAQELGLPFAERSLGCYDMHAADEAFLTGSGAKIVPVSSLDGSLIGSGAPGAITEAMIAAFDRFARDPHNGAALM